MFAILVGYQVKDLDVLCWLGGDLEGKLIKAYFYTAVVELSIGSLGSISLYLSMAFDNNDTLSLSILHMEGIDSTIDPETIWPSKLLGHLPCFQVHKFKKRGARIFQ